MREPAWTTWLFRCQGSRHRAGIGLAIGRIVNEWGVEPVAMFVAGWPDAEGLALANLLMQADRLRRDGPVDVVQLLIKTHAKAEIDDRGRARRKPA